MAAKNRKTRRTLEATKSKFMERTGCEQLEDGVVYASFEAFGQDWYMPHPLFATEEWQEQVDNAENNAGKAEAVLGAEQYARFRSAGGSATDVVLMLMDLSTSLEDDLSETGPTQS